MLPRPVKAAVMLLGVLMTGHTASASPAPASAQSAQQPVGGNAQQDAVYKAMAGAWVGALEYRDYSSNGRVLLPMILHIRKAKDVKSLTLHYIYDDGPTKVVEDFETATIDSAASTYVTTSSDGKDVVTDTLTGLAGFAKTGQGQLVCMGKGQESGKLVSVRTTLTVAPTTLMILKETRLPGQPFLFRDQYTLTRVGPATTGH